jgi:hypothetical protein
MGSLPQTTSPKTNSRYTFKTNIPHSLRSAVKKTLSRGRRQQAGQARRHAAFESTVFAMPNHFSAPFVITKNAMCIL